MDYFALPPQEQQTLANEWLNKPEDCLPWEPIPSRFLRAR